MEDKDLTVFSVHRKLIGLAKHVLEIFDDLEKVNSNRKEKLDNVLNELPDSLQVVSEIVDLYDPIDENFLAMSRKKVLDKANELSREFETESKGKRKT